MTCCEDAFPPCVLSPPHTTTTPAPNNYDTLSYNYNSLSHNYNTVIQLQHCHATTTCNYNIVNPWHVVKMHFLHAFFHRRIQLQHIIVKLQQQHHTTTTLSYNYDTLSCNYNTVMQLQHCQSMTCCEAAFPPCVLSPPHTTTTTAPHNYDTVTQLQHCHTTTTLSWNYNTVNPWHVAKLHFLHAFFHRRIQLQQQHHTTTTMSYTTTTHYHTTTTMSYSNDTLSYNYNTVMQLQHCQSTTCCEGTFPPCVLSRCIQLQQQHHTTTTSYNYDTLSYNYNTVMQLQHCQSTTCCEGALPPCILSRCIQLQQQHHRTMTRPYNYDTVIQLQHYHTTTTLSLLMSDKGFIYKSSQLKLIKSSW